MKLLETVTVGSGGAASIVFNSISADYDDLLLVVSARTNKADSVSTGSISFNGSSSNFTNRTLLGAGSSVFSADYTTTRQINSYNANTSTANTFSTHSVYIPNYRSSVAKSFSAEGATENNGGYYELGIMANLWNVTNPITSITLANEGTVNFVQHTTASLYGIKRGSDGTTVVS
jgi:hypothetical protein